MEIKRDGVESKRGQRNRTKENGNKEGRWLNNNKKERMEGKRRYQSRDGRKSCAKQIKIKERK